MKALGNLLLVAAALAILLYVLFGIPQCSAPKPAPVVPARKELPKSQPDAPDERYKLVDEWLKKHRAAIGICLQKSDRSKVANVRLLLSWKPVGALEAVRLVPDLGQAVRMCLEDLTRSFELPASEDLSPLTVSKRLSLAPR